MFKVSARYARRLAPVALAVALITVLAPVSANAAPFTSTSVSSSNTTPGASNTLTLTVAGATSGSIGCLSVATDTAADFSSGSPALTVASPSVAGGGLFTAGTWTAGTTTADRQTWTGSVTEASGTKSFTLTTTNPSVSVNTTYFVNFVTYSDACTTVVNSGTAAIVIGPNTQVSVTVDPTFTFSVAPQNTGVTCGSVTSNKNISSVVDGSVPFGHMSAGSRTYAVQLLNVSTNAGGGYSVFLRSNVGAGPTAVMANAGGTQFIADSGTVASIPASSVAFFGYSTDSSANSFTGLKSVPRSTSNDNVGYSASATTTGSNCVGYAVNASSATAAGTYSATMVYTAVPTF